MLKPLEMQKVQILSLKSVSEPLVKFLHEQGVMEIRQVEKSDLETNIPFESYQDISQYLVNIRAIKNVFDKSLPKEFIASIPKENYKLDFKSQYNKLINVEKEIQEISKEQSKFSNDLKRESEHLSLSKNLIDFGNIDFSKLNTSTTEYILGVVPRNSIQKCRDALKQSVKDYETAFRIRKNEVLMLIIYPKEVVVEGILNKFGFVKIQLPNKITTATEYKEYTLSNLSKINSRTTELNKRLEDLAREYYSLASFLENYLSIEADRAEIASKFGFGKSSFIIQGWIKSKDFSSLEIELNNKFGNKATIIQTSPRKKELIPTVLENPKIMGQVQSLVKLFSLPNAKEIDPTFLFFFTVPLMYGMIVGDVAYGIISIILGKIFMDKASKGGMLYNVSFLWMFSGFSAIIFGLFFDEWLGMTHFHILEYLSAWGLDLGVHAPLYLGYSRLHNLTGMLGISALVGIFHLSLGFILGAINNWHHNKKHAIAKMAWLVFTLSALVAIMSMMFNMFPEEYGTYALYIAIFASIVIAITEGIVGILEIPGLTGNVLSYTRIAAVGVVGVILAEIINSYLLPTAGGDLLFTIILFPFFVLLHFVNAFIAMVEALVQGGRLNIVEFQSKFLHGEGRYFNPFMLKDKYKI